MFNYGCAIGSRGVVGWWGCRGFEATGARAINGQRATGNGQRATMKCPQSTNSVYKLNNKNKNKSYEY